MKTREFAAAPVAPRDSTNVAEAPSQLILGGKKCNAAMLVAARHADQDHVLLIENKHGEWSCPAGKVREDERRLQPFGALWQRLERPAQQDASGVSCLGPPGELTPFVVGGLRELEEETGIGLRQDEIDWARQLLVLGRDALGIRERSDAHRTELLYLNLREVSSLPDVRGGSDAVAACWASREALEKGMSQSTEGALVKTLWNRGDGPKPLRHSTWVMIEACLNRPLGGAVDTTPGGWCVTLPVNYRVGHALVGPPPRTLGYGFSEAVSFREMIALDPPSMLAEATRRLGTHDIILTPRRLDLPRGSRFVKGQDGEIDVDGLTLHVYQGRGY